MIENPEREVIVKYMKLRPTNSISTKLFLNYRNNKCTSQVIGINKLGAALTKVANYLNLPDAKLYTGHKL